MDHDRDLVDLVLVIGTSLKVAPVSEVVGVLPHHVPQLYISREVNPHHARPLMTITDPSTAMFARQLRHRPPRRLRCRRRRALPACRMGSAT